MIISDEFKIFQNYTATPMSFSDTFTESKWKISDINITSNMAFDKIVKWLNDSVGSKLM